LASGADHTARLEMLRILAGPPAYRPAALPGGQPVQRSPADSRGTEAAKTSQDVTAQRTLAETSRMHEVPPPIDNSPDRSLEQHIESTFGTIRELRGDPNLWGTDGRAQRPIHIPIIPPERLRTIVGAMATHVTLTSRIDTSRLIERMARRRPIWRVPRRTRRSLGKHLVVLCDQGVGMMPFRPDIAMLIGRLSLVVGAAQLKVAEFGAAGHLDLPMDAISSGSTVLILSDLQGFARRNGYAHAGREEWGALAAEIRHKNAAGIVLSPGAPDGRVPLPAFPEIFPISRRALMSIVPWDDGLTAASTSAFVNRRRSAKQVEAKRKVNELPDVLGQMVQLLTMVHDLDRFTLRVIRLALREPARLRTALLAHAKSSPGFAAQWRQFTDVEPASPSAGPYHEYTIWASECVIARDEIATLAPLKDRSGIKAILGMPAAWPRIIALVRNALMLARAGRGLNQYMGDALQWARQPLRDDPERAARELQDLYALGSKLATRDGHERRLRAIDPSFRVSPVIGARDSSSRLSTLTLLRTPAGLEVDLDRDIAGAIHIPLEPGVDLAEGWIEVWSRTGKAPVHRARLWPPSVTVPLKAADGFGIVETIVVRLPRRIVALRLESSRDSVAPLFSASDIPKGDMRFDGENLVIGISCYDPIGLLPLNIRPAAVAKVNFATAGSLHMIKDGVWHDGFDTLFVQPDPRSGEVRAINLPFPERDVGAPSRFAQQGGSIALMGSAAAWHILVEDGGARVVHWRTDPLYARVQELVTSKAGILMLDQTGNTLNLLPTPTVAEPQPNPICVHLGSRPSQIALADNGLVAARVNDNVLIFEPFAAIPPAAVDTVKSSTNTPLAARVRATLSRTWLPPGDYRKATLLEALGSGARDTMSRIYNTLERKFDVTLSSRELQQHLKLDQGAADLFAAVWRGDLAAIAASGFDVDVVIPGSGLSALHLASAFPKPYSRIEALLDRGANINARDPFGCTALYTAAFANDGGEGMALLLERGADPSLNGLIDGITVGPLAPFVSRAAFEEPSDMKLFERLLAGGANPAAFGSTDKWGLLAAAAPKPPSVILRALELDVEVNQVSEDGWSPLLACIWHGNTEAARALIDAGANIHHQLNNGATGVSIAIRQQSLECLALLLDQGASANAAVPRALVSPVVPLDELVTLPEDAEAELVLGMARLLGKAGVDPEAIRPPRSHRLFRDLVGAPLLEGASRQRMLLQGLAESGKPAKLTNTVLDCIKAGFAKPYDFAALLTLPFDAAARGDHGVTLAHIVAAHPASPDVAAHLSALEAEGVDLLVADDHGTTPLHSACAAGHEAAIAELLRRAPELASRGRNDGLTAPELLVLIDRSDLAMRYFGAVPDVKRWRVANQPSTLEIARLQGLPPATLWTISVISEGPRIADLQFASLPVPLPETLLVWTPVLRREATLPYQGAQRLEETYWRRSDGVGGVSARVLTDNKNTEFAVDGTARPIYSLNQIERPYLPNQQAAMAYLKFFCHAVHGNDGAFAVVDSRETLDSHLGTLVDADLTLPMLEVRRVDGSVPAHWYVQATVRYSSTLSVCQFRLLDGGMIEMSGDFPTKSWATGEAPTFGRDGHIFYYC
jgi:ankyrin repeat protein